MTHSQPIDVQAISTGDFETSAICHPSWRFWHYLALPFVIGAAIQMGAAQTVKFNAPVTYPAGNPYVVSSGDFNGDGKVDLIAGDVTNNDLIVLFGNGDGTVKPPLTTHLQGAPYSLAVADFNRDGKLDVALGFT